MNKVFLIGRLTNNPELRNVGENSVTNFIIAVNRNYINQDGEREADFIPIITWNKTAENAKKFLSKGSLIAVDGRIQIRSYEDKDGKRVYITEIIADRVQFLGAKSNSSKDEEKKNEEKTVEKPKKGLDDDLFSEFGSQIEINDDETPF